MRTLARCLLLALLIAGLGLALRRALPVTPVDGAFAAVLRAYAAPQPDDQERSRDNQQYRQQHGQQHD